MECDLRNIRHLALDLDGTLYLGNSLFPETRPFLNCLDRLSIGYSFLTNNRSKSRGDYILALSRLGIDARPEQVNTSSHATLSWLRKNLPQVRRIFLFGTESMAAEFRAGEYLLTGDDSGDEPDAVVVAFDPTMTYSRLGRAAWWISKGKPFIATNPDRVCPTDQATILPDCAAICAALESATGRAPDVVLGKPHPSMLQGILDRQGIEPSQLAVVGDRLYTDIAMAKAMKAVGILVLSSETTAGEAMKSPLRPDLVLANIGDLGRLLEQYNPIHA